MTLLLVVRREIKFLSREFFYFERFQGFFDGLFDTSVATLKPREKKKLLAKKTLAPLYL